MEAHTMTTHDLYAIYLVAYGEASHFRSGGLPPAPAGLASRLRRMLSVERTIEELARHDATNGTPVRSRTAFDRALADGARVLQGIGPGREVPA
jgi:hypothetical protein